MLWFELLLEVLEKFAVKIIGVILITFVLSRSPRLRKVFSNYKKLLEAGQDKDEPSDDEQKHQTDVHLQLEAERQRPAMLIPMKKSPAMNDDDFLELCRSGDARKVEEAIMNGANINARDCGGTTALMVAAYYGYTEIVAVLLKYVADANAKNINGTTALMWAAEGSHTDIAELLLRHGADVNATNNDSNTALELAEMWGKKDIARLLLRYGARCT